jgi:hypothetical protein
MCGVAGEQYPPGPVLVGHPFVDPKPGSSADFEICPERGLLHT